MPETLPADLELSILGPRRLRVYFYTSSTDKYVQARHVFAKYGVWLEHFPQHSEPYDEDYSSSKEILLKRAIDVVIKIVGTGVIFFVEDTSLRIEALSDDGDFPGLRVKEWFDPNTFDVLNQELIERGNDRRAIVKSGIGLHLPGRAQPLYFYGETTGTITNTSPHVSESPIHPWLNSKTFDGWFVPDGCEKTLAEMTAEESFRVHFRAKALHSLLERLGEYSAVLNLPSSTFFLRSEGTAAPQLSLFRASFRRWVVVGARATGKTTFGEFAMSKLGAEHFEASVVVRSFYRELQPEEPDVSRFAEALHERLGNHIVIQTLADSFGLTEGQFVVVTGLRKFEELDYLHRIGFNYQLIFVNASPRTRYDRYVQRGRDAVRMDFKAFSAEERELDTFLRLTHDYADVVINNEFELSYYLKQVDYVLRRDDAPRVKRPLGLLIKSKDSDRKESQILLRCLGIMAEAGVPLSADEIAKLLPGREGPSPKTISRTLRRYRPLYTRIVDSGTSRYSITPIGEMYWRVARVRVQPHLI